MCLYLLSGSFRVAYIPSYSSSHTQTAQFRSVMAGVLLAGRWRPRTSGAGKSACTGEGDTSVEVPSSPLAGSSLQLTALLSKRWTWGTDGSSVKGVHSGSSMFDATR